MATHRSARLLAAAAALVIASTALVISTPAQAAAPAKKHVTLVVTELPAQVRLIPGEAVTVRLSTNLTTGYTWSTKVVGRAASVSVSKGEYTAPTTELMGAPGTTTWVVTATRKGTAVVKYLTTPPGGGTPQADGSLTVIVR